MTDDVPVIYIPRFIHKVSTTSEIYNTLLNELDWVQIPNCPRMEYYINTHDAPYTYGSGKGRETYQRQPNHAIIDMIKMMMYMEYDYRFEICFLNYYKDQSQHLGWHSDNSPEMDDDRSIAIVSFGVPREIWFRPIDGGEATKKLLLEDGSLCIMKPGMQDTHQHRIPKASSVVGGRISLTFRGYKQP